MKIKGSDTSREINIMRMILFTHKLDIKKLTLRSPTSKERDKRKKGTKHQRFDRHDIKGVVTKAKFQI